MNPALIFQPGAAGLTLAAAAIVAGAPLFSSGLRAARLRAKFRRLQRFTLAEHPGGFAHVSGRVELESPLFAPLSALPCAGFRLEVHADGLKLHRHVDERRAFRIEDGPESAIVSAPRGPWLVAPTGEREVRAAEPLRAGLLALLERVPEALWWRRAGGTLHLVERALQAGAECHVVGTVRPASVAAVTLEWVRTGTDSQPVTEELISDPALTVGPDDHLDFVLVGDRPPRSEDLHISDHHVVGVIIGPALSLTGMLYLASVADYLRALGRF